MLQGLLVQQLHVHLPQPRRLAPSEPSFDQPFEEPERPRTVLVQQDTLLVDEHKGVPGQLLEHRQHRVEFRVVLGLGGVGRVPVGQGAAAELVRKLVLQRLIRHGGGHDAGVVLGRGDRTTT